jgi:hypothetical protein
MTDTYQQAQDAMAEHAKQMQANRAMMEQNPLRSVVAALHDASCRCGACFHAAQDQRMAEATAATSTWRQCAEARAAQLDAAQDIIADHESVIADLSASLRAAQATIADLRAMLAAQQAVIDDGRFTVLSSCTCHPSEAPVPCQHKYAFSECRAAAPAFPARALRGGDGVPK